MSDHNRGPGYYGQAFDVREIERSIARDPLPDYRPRQPQTLSDVLLARAFAILDGDVDGPKQEGADCWQGWSSPPIDADGAKWRALLDTLGLPEDTAPMWLVGWTVRSRHHPLPPDDSERDDAMRWAAFTQAIDWQGAPPTVADVAAWVARTRAGGR